jgi:4-amino-4-deoxy-L-arabinose transferase-like glycosyltransferase
MIERIPALVAGLVCLALIVHVERAPERPLAQQPFPDALEYADSARSLARGDGFFTHVHQGSRQPPRYPPGYPLALAPFAAAGSYPRDVQLGAKAYAMFYVLVAVVAAWTLGGPLAAIFAALLVGTSPFARDAAGLVMADAFVAALTVLSLPLLAFATRSGARLAGAATGLAMLARLTAGINLIALLVTWPRKSVKTVVLYAVPALVGLALLQWAMFGSPSKTGYDYWGVSGQTFALDNATSERTSREGPFIIADRLDGELVDFVCPCRTGGAQASLPNVTFYPLLLVGAFWVFSPPLIPLLGLLYAWRRRRDPVGRYALALTALSLLVFVFYFFQGTRFMAGAATVLTVLGSVWLAELADRLRRRRVAPTSALARLRRRPC